MQKPNQLARVESRNTAVAAAVFLIPAIALIIVYMIYPIIDTFLTSQYSWNGISTDKLFIGLDNWKTLLHDQYFWAAFKHNVIVMIFSILLQIPIGMLLATFLDAGGRRLNIFKIIWFLPYLMSSVAIAFLFTYILATNGGLFSTIATLLKGKRTAVDLLGKSPQALYAVIGVIDVTIRRNHIHHCIEGVWLDWEAQGARISQNLMHDNLRPDGIEPAQGAMFSCDIFIEVGHGPTLIDNNVLLSKMSVVMPSEGLAVVHNLMCGAFGLINSGVDSIVNGQREPRFTPYHIRHRTEVAGFMTILHGDDRIYNNIIVQKWPVTDETKTPQDNDYQVAGTAPFDIFPSYDEWIANFMMGQEPDMRHLAQFHFGHLPAWVDGNACFNGASVSRHEKHGLVNKEDAVSVEVCEADGQWLLKTNVYDLLGDFRDGILTTEALGCAFEPEERFENPDGTPIVFDRDFLGNHRALSALPGPFAEGKAVTAVW